MHPDKKVGLSLGILLIGVTAAFFFRNEVPIEQAEAPELVDPESLDNRIRRKSQTPYLPERADATADAEAAAPAVRDVAVTDVLPPDSRLRQSLPEAEVESTQPGDEPAARITPVVPIPAVDQNEVDQALSQVAPDQRVQPIRRPDLTQTVRSAEPQFHVVVENDTLSGISQKYLGSSRRYREIFEANRDKLDSPDDIRLGMKLRIPNGAGDKASNTSPTKPAAAASANAVEEPRATPTEPVATPATDDTPVRPSFVRPQGNGRLPGRRTSQNGGRLSQQPPPGLPVVTSFNPDQARAVIASRPRDDSADDDEKDSEDE